VLIPSAGSNWPVAARGLSPTIGVAQGTALYLGAVLGAGVLILPGAAATIAGPASVVSWALLSLLGLPLALAFAALAARYPDAGGVASFAARAFGPRTGGVVGWLYFVAAATGQVVVALTGAYYAAVPLGLGRAGIFAVAAAILAVAVAANMRGLRVSAGLQLALAGAVAGLLAVAALAAIPRMSAANWKPFAPHGVRAVGDAGRVIFFAVFGWEAVAQLSAEFRDPARDVPRSTLLSVGVISALYVGIAAATVGTHAYGSLAVDRVSVAKVLGDGVGLRAADAAAVMAVLVATATANAFVAATSRLGYALARDGQFPRIFAGLGEDGVPRRAVALVGAYAASGLALAYVAGWGAERLLPVPNALGLATYLVAMAAAVKLLAGRARLFGAAGLAFCAAVTPFFGASLAAVGVVGLVAAAYLELAAGSPGRSRGQ